MTLLTICQNVADTVTIAKPGAIVGINRDDTRKLLVCAKQAGQDLYRSHNWVALQTEHTFSTADGTADYSLPSDFGRLIGDTVWDRSNYWDMRGGLSPQEWQLAKSSILSDSVTTRKRYRIRNVSGTVKFSIDPTPDAVESLVFEYVSKNWCETSGGTGQSTWSADTNVGVLDEYLLELGTLWRFLKRLGMAYGDEAEEYKREVDRAIARDGGSRVLRLNEKSRLSLIGPQNIPDTGYGS